MINIKVFNSSAKKKVQEWCRENGYIYKMDSDDSEKDSTVPFKILAPSSAEKELKKFIKNEL